MVTGLIPTNGTRQLLLLFVVTVGFALGVFYAYNRSLHRQEVKLEQEDCISDRQLAQNQRRVLEALLVMARHHPDVQERPILFALARVPNFDCEP